MKHHYGPRVHWLDRPLLNGLLAELCSPRTTQPRINRLIAILYGHLLAEAAERRFAIESFREPTRMTATHPGVLLEGRRVAASQRAVVVNLARAGTWPSHLCYEALHETLPPENLRQDHIMAARIADEATHHVTGTSFGGVKIGGSVRGAHVLIPDPMGATGSTIIETIDHYKNQIEGPAASYTALHLIVTPEYLRRVLKAHPDLEVVTLRVDRGLSPPEVLAAEPGTHWELEKGLNENDYIVPGGGGFGEIMNNSFV